MHATKVLILYDIYLIFDVCISDNGLLNNFKINTYDIDLLIH